MAQLGNVRFSSQTCKIGGEWNGDGGSHEASVVQAAYQSTCASCRLEPLIRTSTFVSIHSIPASAHGHGGGSKAEYGTDVPLVSVLQAIHLPPFSIVEAHIPCIPGEAD